MRASVEITRSLRAPEQFIAMTFTIGERCPRRDASYEKRQTVQVVFETALLRAVGVGVEKETCPSCSRTAVGVLQRP